MIGELVYVPCRIKRDGDGQVMVIENAAGELVRVTRGGVEIVEALFCMVAKHVGDVEGNRRVVLLDSGLEVIVRPIPEIDQWKPTDHFTRKKVSSWATAV
jgi:hypothetical protein